MKLALFLEESSWKNKRLESGIKGRRISRDYKMKDLIFYNQLWLKEKRKQKKNMLKELKKLD